MHLTQVNNESAKFTTPQPQVEAAYFLPDGLRTVETDSTTQVARFTSSTTGYYYPETDLCICSEPYHSQTEAPHGPSHRCMECGTRLPPVLTLAPSRLGQTEPAVPATADHQTLPAAMCSKCIPLTTDTLKLDYPLAFKLPTITAPMCHHCTLTYIRVRKDGDPDPTGPFINLFSPCQCHVWLKHLMHGRVCYSCKLKECQRRTGLAQKDREMYRAIVGEGVAKGTLSTAYSCRCGRKILGEQDFEKRGLARCVVCERVVVRDGFRMAFDEGFCAGEESGSWNRDEDGDGNGNGTQDGGDGNEEGVADEA